MCLLVGRSVGWFVRQISCQLISQWVSL